MNEFLAIVGDTWRQSRQQVVFIIMCIIFALLVAAAAILPKVMIDEHGDDAISLIGMDKPAEFLPELWILEYAKSLTLSEKKEEQRASDRGFEDFVMNEGRQEAQRRAHEIPVLQRGGEMFLLLLTYALFTFSMWFFIAACASYFPNLLAEGAVDLVISNPLSRFRIFFAKFLGGLVLYSVASAIALLGLIVAVGLKIGVWQWQLLSAIPLQVFCAGVLFALVALLGVVSRSTALSIVVGYLFYFLIDTTLEVLQGLQIQGVFVDYAWADSLIEWSRYLLPNFGFLRSITVSRAVNIPSIDWAPVGVAAVWMGLALLLGYWKFRRTDY